MPPKPNKSEQFTQLVERINSATNILVTVSNSPSVDQLAACIGLTVALNKHGKHATAVYSGKTPSTIEFLEPEKTIETNTNSLRDFIISLDKSKADKLRYKVEDDFVKIFITPYRTSISDADLNFSQGDFNVDLIITLGVHERGHLDEALVAHGRILHDATVASMNTDSAADLGTINWVDNEASSLCEMSSDLLLQVDKNLIDSQIATALLTGMVAETDRFGNEKARPHTMSVSGVLMAAGASTQLIVGKLQEPVKPEKEDGEPGDEIPAVVDGEGQGNEGQQEEKQPDDGTIEIEHTPEHDDNIHIDEHGRLQAIEELEAAQKEMEEAARKQAEEAAVPVPPPSETTGDSRSIVQGPPQFGGRLTANSIPEEQQYSPSTDPLSNIVPAPMLDRTGQDSPTPLTPPAPPVFDEPVEELLTPPEMPQGSITEGQTLSDIEKAVNSLHLQDDQQPAGDTEEAVPPPPPVDDARAAVEQAAQNPDLIRPEPISALGANPVDLDLGHEEPQLPDEEKLNDSGNAPPPVPPPLMPPGV